MTLQVTDQAHLEALPDGSIVSWLRIPGDETSRAIAFVRVELEQRVDLDGRPMAFGNEAPGAMPGMMRTVWISPGGYSPQTPESAGVTYPADVIVMGEFRPEDYPSGTEIPMPQLSPPALLCETLTSGGTYPRDLALQCAVRTDLSDFAFSNADTAVDYRLDLADKYVSWLDRPFTPSVDESVVADIASDDWGDAGPPPVDASNSAYEQRNAAVEQLEIDLQHSELLLNKPGVRQNIANYLVDHGWRLSR